MRPKRYLRVKVSLNEVELAHFRARAQAEGKAVAECIREDALASRFCALAASVKAAA